jgi:hypothetical protein
MTVPTPLPDWWLPACRKHYGLAKTRPPEMPKPAPAWCITEWGTFDSWNAWRDKQPGYKRPAGLWLRVPDWAWVIRAELLRAHQTPPPPPPPPVPAPSWTLPGPLVFTASDPNAANGHAGVGTIGKIINLDPDGSTPVCPLWECFQAGGGGPRGLCGQVEGQGQLQVAFDLIQHHRQNGDHLAVVGTGGVPAARLVAIGVTSFFMEGNAQVGWEPYGNAAELLDQALRVDGWPHAKISYGVYDGVSLAAYAANVPMVWDYARNELVAGTQAQGLPGKDFAVYSAEGIGDCASWGTLAAL